MGKRKNKSAPADELFKQETDGKEDSYIKNCPECGAVVTRAEYKCHQCGKMLL